MCHTQFLHTKHVHNYSKVFGLLKIAAVPEKCTGKFPVRNCGKITHSVVFSH